MKKQAISLGLALASAAGLGLVGLAHAAADPQSFTTATDPDNVGTLTLYDASGHPVTGGNLTDAPIAAYAVGSAPLRAGDDRAALFAYTASADNPGAWTGGELSADTAFPAAGAPAAASGLPTATLGAASLDGYVKAYPAPTTGDLAGHYELRLRSSAAGTGLGTSYDALDIVVSGSTWSVAGSSTAASTTTSLAVTPSGAQAGATLTLTATVSPAEAAGTVQFRDGSTPIGSPVAVSGGVATTSVTATGGTHGFVADFAPTDAGAYSSSEGTASYTVAAVATTTTLTVSPAAPKAGAKVTLSARVAPAAAGKVQFYDGSARVGSPVAVGAGKASTTTIVKTAAKHGYKAVFTPTSVAAYKSSTATKSVTVAKATPTLALTLPASVSHTARATLTVTAKVANLTVSGTVTIYDGTKKLGTAAVRSGKATYRLPALKKGKHTIKVSYAATSNVAAKSVTKSVTSK